MVVVASSCCWRARNSVVVVSRSCVAAERYFMVVLRLVRRMSALSLMRLYLSMPNAFLRVSTRVGGSLRRMLFMSSCGV